MVGIIDRLKRRDRIHWIEPSGKKIIVEIYGLVDGIMWLFPFFFLFFGAMTFFFKIQQDEFAWLFPWTQAIMLGIGFLCFGILLRQHVRCVILVGDGITGRLYALQETFGWRRKVLLAKSFADVRAFTIHHSRGSHDVGPSDTLYIEFTNRRRFNGGRTRYENIEQVKLVFEALIHATGEQEHSLGEERR